MRKRVLFGFLLFAGGLVHAQPILNPSLEGPVGSSVVPPNWDLCSGSPDTQILQGTGIGIYGINTPPANGSSYLGMVTTAGYIEMAGQSVSWTAGTTYAGSIKLYRSNLHPNWNGTGQLRIWTGTSCSNMATLAWTSGTINNLNNWQTYPITITPANNVSYLIFENFHNVGTGDMNYFCMDDIILSATVLSVQLMNFAATDRADGLNLDWELDGLEGEETIELEWSADAANFESIARTQVDFQSGIWSHAHKGAAFGMNYYRLKVVDQNGQAVLSEIRQAEHKSGIVSQAFPNPANGSVSLRFDQAEAGLVSVKLMDSAGRVVHVVEGHHEAGMNTVQVDYPAELAPGVYYLKAMIGQQSAFHTISIL